MRILNVFIDMVGADYLHITNCSNEVTELDSFLKELGGTFYTNCYTPSPDTPRSTACMWSGLYPRANGCNNRLKYPRRFLYDSTQGNLWEFLRDNNVELNAFIRKTSNEIGLLPNGFQNVARSCSTIGSFVKEWEPSPNSFSFIYIHDLHSYLDNNGYTPKKFKRGIKLVVKVLRELFTRNRVDDFDYIMVYSDHGFRCEGVKKNHLLDNDRVKTLMFVRKKGDKELLVDDSLRSVLDVYPTVVDMFAGKATGDLDGKTLFGKEHDYLLLEDHDDFSVRLSQSIEHWAVFTKNNKYWLECSGKWHRLNEDNTNLLQYEELIRKKMNDYEENHKLWKALHIYDENKLVDKVYSDGSRIIRPFYRGKRIMAIKIIFCKFIGLFK